MDIADEAYDFLSTQLQKQYDPENYDIKHNLKLFKESKFLELVAEHVLESAIKLD